MKKGAVTKAAASRTNGLQRGKQNALQTPNAHTAPSSSPQALTPTPQRTHVRRDGGPKARPKSAKSTIQFTPPHNRGKQHANPQTEPKAAPKPKPKRKASRNRRANKPRPPKPTPANHDATRAPGSRPHGHRASRKSPLCEDGHPSGEAAQAPRPLGAKANRPPKGKEAQPPGPSPTVAAPLSLGASNVSSLPGRAANVKSNRNPIRQPPNPPPRCLSGPLRSAMTKSNHGSH